MSETIHIGDVVVALTRKDVMHVHLSVHPPGGRVTLVAPRATRPEVARAYAVSKLGWIRDQQAKLREQARETPRHFVERESHYLWGRRYLLSVREEEAKPSIRLGHRDLTLTVRPGSGRAKREAVVHECNGLLVPLGDIRALANAVIRVLTDRGLANEMSAKGRGMALERFDEQATFATVKAEYRRLLSKKRPFSEPICSQAT